MARGIELLKKHASKQFSPPAAKESPPAANTSALPNIEPLPCYYDSGSKTFWARNARAEWVNYTTSSIKLFLRAHGFSQNLHLSNGLTQIEHEFCRIQLEQDIHYAGPLAGFNVGYYEMGGRRVLVTRDPVLITPAKGNAATLDAFLDQLLGEQAIWFHGWMRAALQARHAGPPFRPGQVLVLAGPPGCGKSLLQSLVTEILGGRSQKPYRYLTGQTPFNSELFEAEHLQIEDEAATTDLRTRKTLGANLKNLCVNEQQSCHPKGRPALSLCPFWRVTVSLNDEPESMMVLPPLDSDLRDKFILLRALPTKLPFDAEKIAERKAFRDTLSAELPAYLQSLRTWKVPRKMIDQRYGIKSFADAELVRALDDLAPEMRLWSLIESLGVIGLDPGCWEGTATELERRLRELDKSKEVDRLLTFHTACGVYLSRLAQKRPELVQKGRGPEHSTRWLIYTSPHANGQALEG